MTEKLKPCPFCGSNNIHLNKIMSTYSVDCGDCEATTGEMFDESEEKAKIIAITNWNRRAKPWHTGTPTEKGWYLQCIKSKNNITYDTDYYENGDWKYFCIFREIVAWQKIEPYEFSK